MARKGLLIQLDDAEKASLQAIAEDWGVSLAGAVRRLIRDKKKASTEG